MKSLNVSLSRYICDLLYINVVMSDIVINIMGFYLIPYGELPYVPWSFFLSSIKYTALDLLTALYYDPFVHTSTT